MPQLTYGLKHPRDPVKKVELLCVLRFWIALSGQI
jgi:hypothetical protein